MIVIEIETNNAQHIELVIEMRFPCVLDLPMSLLFDELNLSCAFELELELEFEFEVSLFLSLLLSFFLSLTLAHLDMIYSHCFAYFHVALRSI